MKSIFTFFYLILFLTSYGQVSFSDDFESYPADGYVAANNPKWTTWNKKPGTDEDAKVSKDLAKSGTQSVKIFSVSTQGGPTDLVLPFGARYTSGNFTFRMSMYIPSGKNGYFNFQGTTTTGQSWALDANFAYGNANFTRSGSNLLSTSFNHDQWFDLVVDINLTANIWAVSVDGQCKGAFFNTTNAIASLDLFPIDNSSLFYVDDVSFDYTPSAPVINRDAGLGLLLWNSGRLAGSEGTPTMTIVNNGKDTLKYATVNYKVNGVVTSEKITNINLAKGKSKELRLPAVILNGGMNTIEVTLDSINGVGGDDFACNNYATRRLEGVIPADYKAILVEEGTGPWCQWCPRGAVFMDRYNHYYPNLFIPIAVHNGTTNPMKIAEYDDFLDFTAFPASRLNRKFDQDPGIVEGPFLAEITIPTPVIVKPGAKYDEAGRVLDVSTTVEFLKNASGNYSVTVVLTEDGVRGTSTAYNQANAYAGGANGVMGGYETLPNPVPAAKMVYHHVARAVSGLKPETSNIFSGSYNTGDKVTLNTVFELDPNWNPDSLHIISIVLDDSKYVNASRVTIDEAKANGFISKANDLILAQDQVKLYPNPAQETTSIYIELKSRSKVSIEIMDMQGKVVANRNYGELEGEMILPVQIGHMPAGNYLAKVQTSEGVIIRKLSVN